MVLDLHHLTRESPKHQRKLCAQELHILAAVFLAETNSRLLNRYPHLNQISFVAVVELDLYRNLRSFSEQRSDLVFHHYRPREGSRCFVVAGRLHRRRLRKESAETDLLNQQVAEVFHQRWCYLSDTRFAKETLRTNHSFLLLLSLSLTRTHSYYYYYIILLSPLSILSSLDPDNHENKTKPPALMNIKYMRPRSLPPLFKYNNDSSYAS